MPILYPLRFSTGFGDKHNIEHTYILFPHSIFNPKTAFNFRRADWGPNRDTLPQIWLPFACLYRKTKMNEGTRHNAVLFVRARFHSGGRESI